MQQGLIDNRARVISAYEAGLTCREIWQTMPEVGVSRDTKIANALRGWGITMRPARPRRVLNDAQEATVLKVYAAGRSIPDIVNHFWEAGLRVSITPIHGVLKRHGVQARNAGAYKVGKEPHNRRNTDESEAEMLLLYAQGCTAQAIADQFNFKTGKTVLDVLKKNGVKPRRGSRIDYCQDSVWHEAFSDVCTEDQAYWLGILITDGWISKVSGVDAWQIGLQLKESDLAHVEKLKVFLKSKSKISRVKKVHGDKTYWMYRLMVNSHQMKYDLERYGVVERKSDKTFLPELRPDLMRHMLRGILDGDGCIFRSKGVIAGIAFAGTARLVRKCVNQLLQETGVSDRNLTKNASIWEARWTRSAEISVILDYLYRDSNVYLDRKMALCKEWLNA